MNRPLTEDVLAKVELALDITLMQNQRRFLLSNDYDVSGGRRSGKTTVRCVALALSDGEVLDFRMCNVQNNRQGWNRRFFHKIYKKLKEGGLDVREAMF